MLAVKELKEMAIIHLQNVAQTINELQSQKQNIENEINKLVKYYEEKINLVKDETLNSVQVD
jgi:hypothetical protein